MNEFTTYQFNQCVARYFPAAEYLETVFPDGKKCPAQFSFNDDDHKKALTLGYYGDSPSVRQMHLEHELTHTFIAEALGEPWCPVLRSVAVKGPCEGAWEREELVMAFQRFLNGGKVSRALNWGWKGTRYLDESAEEFKRRFRP